MNHIISLKDGSYYRLTKEEANVVFRQWANQQEAIVIPRGVSISHRDIRTVSDLDSWIKHENMTLQKRNQSRCSTCLAIKENGITCVCREKDRPIEYQPKGLNGIFNHLVNSQKKVNPPKEELVKVINIILQHFDWAKEWWKTDSGKKSVTNYAKVVWRIGYFKLFNGKIMNVK